ncbi:MAG: cysteine desulfurase NifS [Clostridia bacterium]|nr:cysteine desulfurase NifS [Clostridia bacterium]
MIYLDHAATTYTDEAVLKEMLPYYSEVYGNASSLHAEGRKATAAVDQSRERVARALGCKKNEVYFTSGGTESDNWAIRGVAYAKKEKGKHIITSKIEHHAVLHTVEQLEKEGFSVTYLDVDEYGTVSPESVAAAIRPDTVLVTVMAANNEVGTLQPIKEIAQICKERGVLMHTDAVQAIGAVPINVQELGVDLLSLSGHKFYGPKGIGVLYVRSGVRLQRFMLGGAQERSMRGGTSNTPGIVGLGFAIEKAVNEMEENNAHVTALRDRFIAAVTERIPYCRLNGHPQSRLPNNANFSFQYVEGESILLSLDFEDICVSSGSACTSGSLEPSHVLLAMGMPEELAHGSIRFTFGKRNTVADVDKTVDVLQNALQRLRAMSPLFPG